MSFEHATCVVHTSHFQRGTTLAIRNAGGGALSWTLGLEAPWLHADVLQGQSTGEVDIVILSADASALSHGTYSATLTVSAPHASNSPRLVQVFLYVSSTLYVPSEYPTIQGAIDAAVPRDDVLLADGVYTGLGNKDLDFRGKPITLRSASGDPTACIIDCQGSGRGFYFHSGETAEATVSDITIRNGHVTDQSPGYWGGGAVHCCFVSNPTLTNCTISGSSCTRYGGGVCCWHSNPTLIDCRISGNTTVSNGGGMYCAYSDPILTNCTISGNTAPSTGSSDDGHGAGLYCASSSNPTLTNCTITGNTAAYLV